MENIWYIVKQKTKQGGPLPVKQIKSYIKQHRENISLLKLQ